MRCIYTKKKKTTQKVHTYKLSNDPTVHTYKKPTQANYQAIKHYLWIMMSSNSHEHKNEPITKNKHISNSDISVS